jgi:hypothetical protein
MAMTLVFNAAGSAECPENKQASGVSPQVKFGEGM